MLSQVGKLCIFELIGSEYDRVFGQTAFKVKEYRLVADIVCSNGKRIFQWIDIHRKMRFFIGAKSGEVMTGRLTEEGSRNEYRSNRQ